ncbi:DUF202 domain-containing protein [Paraconexibacter sp.]|uniref:DUF202 domain-containing protein n=1 Tax=Paraconexibacter sp. TaxID=2949640 RepID=UPI00356ABF1C
MSPDSHNHPSLARERTVLAWGRTGLALMATAALSLRAGVLEGSPAAVLAAFAALGGVVVGVAVSRRAGRRPVVSDLAAIARDVRTLVVSIALTGAAALVLVVVSVRDAS